MDKKFSKYREDILNGNIAKTLLVLGWPLMIGGLLHTMYNLIDTFWLGKLGKEAITAPANTWPIVWLMISLGMGAGIAGIALVSQYNRCAEKRDGKQSGYTGICVHVCNSNSNRNLWILFFTTYITFCECSPGDF